MRKQFLIISKEFNSESDFVFLEKDYNSFIELELLNVVISGVEIEMGPKEEQEIY